MVVQSVCAGRIKSRSLCKKIEHNPISLSLSLLHTHIHIVLTMMNEKVGTNRRLADEHDRSLNEKNARRGRVREKDRRGKNRKGFFE